jgi:hypothetical protein
VPELEVVEETLPQGANSKYDVGENHVITYLSPSKQFASVGPGLKGQWTCPLLQNLTAAELKRFRLEIVKACPSAISMRIIHSATGHGLCVTAIDAKYKAPQPKTLVSTVDLSTLSGEQKALWASCRSLPTHEEGDQGPTCGQNCVKFMPLQGNIGIDWGVCVEVNGPRGGLLTNKDMKCSLYEKKPVPVKSKPKPPVKVPAGKPSDPG